MLNGVRVLVVEDERLVADHIAEVLEEADADVVGPISTGTEARQLVRSGVKIDVAVLDLTLADGPATPLLEALTARKVPTIVYSGAALPDAIRRRHPDLVSLTKPAAPARLIAELRGVIGQLVVRAGAAPSH
jgi:DNA-binding NtrC family response regulator